MLGGRDTHAAPAVEDESEAALVHVEVPCRMSIVLGSARSEGLAHR
jgi:hypothetical protein